MMSLLVSLLLFTRHQPSALVESWSPKNAVPVVSRGTGHGRRPVAFEPFRSPGLARPLSRTIRSAGTAPGEEPGGDDFIEIESLSAGQVLELIELSFFQACYALSKGDVQPLKLFVVAVVTASKKYPGATAGVVCECVDALPPSVRTLDETERDLRETWIRAVYLVMEHVLGTEDDEEDDREPGESVASTYGPILADLVGVHQTGMGLNANRFVESRKDLLFPDTGEKAKGTGRNILALEDTEPGIDEEEMVRLAVVTQTVNVLFTTLVVLGEEEEDGGDNEPKNQTKPKSSSGRGFG